MHRSLSRRAALGVAAFVAIVPAAAYAAPVAYWRFDNDGKTAGQTADTILDETANDNDGVAKSAATPTPVLGTYSSSTFGPTVPQSGLANTLSLDLERTNLQYVEVADSNSLDFANSPFTIEAWVKLDQASAKNTDGRQYVAIKKPFGAVDAQLNYSMMASIGDLAANFGTTGASLTGREVALSLGTGSAYQTAASSLTINDTNWHFISAAFDPTANTVRFTLDGSVDVVTGVTTTAAANAGPLYLGAHFNGSSVLDGPFDGMIDEVRISSGVVPANELLNVPEPSGAGVLAGMGLLALARRRRR